MTFMLLNSQKEHLNMKSTFNNESMKNVTCRKEAWLDLITF